VGVCAAGGAPSPLRASSEAASAVLTREALAGADGAGLKAMRGAATAELLRCAELLRSVGGVDCGSNTTMLAYCGVCGSSEAALEAALDCETSLSSSTSDLQRRTWGMYCASAPVGC
jgi:hypothetical protein